MDSPINTRSLKEKFYSQHFKEYQDFVLDTDISSRTRRGLSKTLLKLNEQVKNEDKELFPVTPKQNTNDPDKTYEQGPYLKTSATETEMVISVEEFFLIIDKSEDIKEKVDQILRYTEVESGNGSIPELEQTTEDTIIRSICDYFWKRYDKIDIERKDKKDVSKDVDSNYHYEDLKTYTYEDIIKIIGGIISTINSGIGVVNFLHICRKIRNIDVHNGRFFGLKEGYEINCFRLFTYMATVLLLRKSLERKGKMSSFKFDKITMPVFYPKGSSCVIKLYSGDELIRPKKNKDGVVEYEVEWYRLYRLDISKHNVSKERIFTWNEFYPCAKFDGATIDIENAPNASSGIHNRSFHHVAESLKVVEDVLVDIDSKTGSIDNTVSNIDTKLDIFIKYGQNNSEIIRGLRGDLQEGFQKLIESFHQFINKQNGPLDLDKILKLLVEQYESKQIEIERKRKRGLTINIVVIALFLTLALFSFVSSILYDYSILWLSHKTSILCITLILSCVFVYSIWGCCKLSKRPHNIKLAASIGVSSLFVLFIGGLYYAIPHKTANDFIENYQFVIHNYNDNLKAVEYMEKLREENPENGIILAQLTNYYLNYSDCIEKAVQVSRPLENVEKYDYLSEWAAVAAYQIGDYEKTLSIIDNYNKCYNRSTVIMNTLYGAMTVFGYGVNQDYIRGLEILHDCIKEPNSEPLAYYYLGKLLSYDYTANDLSRTFLSPYNLCDAIYCYRKASKSILNASLELGKIYSDLNVVDSASLYFNKIISSSNGVIRNEAIFYMGLLKENAGSTAYNSYLAEATRNNYSPALLHKALTETDKTSAINIYNKMGGYHGVRYLSPVAFVYLERASKCKEEAKKIYRERALNSLNETQKKGNFDINFVLGMECLLGFNSEQKVDSLKGMNYMHLSADHGCLFAKMLCLFKEKEKAIKDGREFKIDDLDNISEIIPFAHVIISYLFQLANENGEITGDTISGNLNYYKYSLKAAESAMRASHPGGAIMVSNMSEYIYFWLNHKETDSNDAFGYQRELLTDVEMALRFIKDKETLAYLGIGLDVLVHSKDNKFDSEHYHFWGDIAMANHWDDITIRIISLLPESDEYRDILTNSLSKKFNSSKEMADWIESLNNYKSKLFANHQKNNLLELSNVDVLYEFSNKKTTKSFYSSYNEW